MQLTSNKIKLSIFVLLLAVVSTVATVYMRVEVLNKAELNNLVCGWPMPYLSSGYLESRFDPPYPWSASCVDLVAGEWGGSVKVQWSNLILNVGFFYLLWVLLLFAGLRARNQKKQKHVKNQF